MLIVITSMDWNHCGWVSAKGAICTWWYFPRIRNLKSLLACCLLFCAVSAQASDWELARNVNGITVETRTVEGEGLKEFRGRTTVKARLSSIVALMNDIDKAPLWMHDNEGITHDELISPQDRWLYIVNGAPWPLRTRDAYLHVLTTQDPESKAVVLDITAHPQRNVADKKMVRIQRMRGGWRFDPNADKTVDVTYAMFLDPGGSVPKTLANMVVVENPFNTLVGFLRMLETGDYDDAEIDWIVEP